MTAEPRWSYHRPRSPTANGNLPQRSKDLNITRGIYISRDMNRRMNQHPNINWSEVARRAIEDALHELELEP